ncbi:MAG: hypothetical protein KC731_31540 [Myxococcales bacterium]|nr:hypothetical protein [Myxococcales bacterium]
MTDVDLAGDDSWVVACRDRRGAVVVATADGPLVAPARLHHPIVRWMGGDRILVVEPRVAKGGDNAYVLTRAGEMVVRARVGDGVQDVMVAGDRVVVTYFDEGVFGDVGPSSEGLCVFGPELELDFGYQSGVKDPVDIVDCYCACLAGPHEVCFSPHPGFPLVRLNLKTRKQAVLALPAELAGANALATDGVDFFVYGPYGAKTTIFRWSPKHGDVEQVGTLPRPARGYGRGTFIAPERDGYVIVDVA